MPYILSYIHYTPPAPGRRAHPHHTTGGEGDSTMADPWPWRGAEGGWNAGPYICMYVCIYVCVCSYLQMLQQLPTGSQCRQSHRRLLLHKRDRWEDKQLHPQAHTFHITGIKSSRFWGSLRFFDSWTIVNLMARDLLRLNYLNMFLRCVGF